VSEDTKKVGKTEPAATELSEQELEKVAAGVDSASPLLKVAPLSGKEVVVETITLTNAEIPSFVAGR
jgi:hypothetical protein